MYAAVLVDDPLVRVAVHPGRPEVVMRVRVQGGPVGTNRYCRTGDHRPEGLFVAAGPGIGPARLSRSVSVMDLAPTPAALLDVEVPSPDGQPIHELLAARPRAGA